MGLHLLVILAFLVAGYISPGNKYHALAVMDFAYYDPEGGSPGGGEGVEPSTGPVPGLGDPRPMGDEAEEAVPEEVEQVEPEQVESEQVEQAEFEPAEPIEPAEPAEPSDLPEFVTSTAEEAAPLPPPPPIEEVREAKPAPKPRPAPKAAPKPAPEARPQAGGVGGGEGGAGGGALPGEARAGGGLGSGRGGVGGGTGIGNPNALNAYASKIRAKLNRYKKYPPEAASKRIGGAATVNFTVNRQGEVISSRLARSSGQAMLDEEAMALLRRCSPFPPMPEELPHNTLNLTVPISFSPPRI